MRVACSSTEYGLAKPFKANLPQFRNHPPDCGGRHQTLIDTILSHLESAEHFEANAVRLKECECKPPRWESTHAQCLADAKRARTFARKLASNEGWEPGLLVQDTRRAQAWPSYARDVTIRDVLRWAQIARTSSIGTRKLTTAAARMRRVAELLSEADALAQLVWWAGDLELQPPGSVKSRLAHEEVGR